MKKSLKIVAWCLLGLVLLVLALPVALYIPVVQDFAVGIASRELSKSTGLEIEIQKLRLKFPLRLSVDNTKVLTAAGDTMLTSENLTLNVKLRALLSGSVEIEGADIRNTFYQMGTRDSSLWLRAHISHGNLNDAVINLKRNNINLPTADFSGLRLDLIIQEDTIPTPTDTTVTAPWKIALGNIHLSDLNYRMEMHPLIDSLNCYIGDAMLKDALVDIGKNHISGRSLSVDSVDAAYFYPAVTPATETSSLQSDSADANTIPWTITADSLSLTAKRGLYAASGAIPAKGFDPSYIEVSDVDLKINKFYNRGTSITVPLTRLTLTERCGLSMTADGTFAMDSTQMTLSDFMIETLRSSLKVNASMGVGDLTSDPDLPLSLQGNAFINPQEVALAFPDFSAYTQPLNPIALTADIEGTASALNVYQISMRMDKIANASLQGVVTYPFDSEKIGGELSINGQVASLSDRRYKFLPLKVTPEIAINGTLAYHPGNADGELELKTRNGSIVGSGNWVARSESYSASLELDRFPVDAFMPELGIGNVTASATIDGKGYNPMNRNTKIDADVVIHKIDYNKLPLENISFTGSLEDGELSGSLLSNNKGADAKIDFLAHLDGDTVRWDIESRLNSIDLMALGMADTVNSGSLDFNTTGYFNLSSYNTDAEAEISNLRWNLSGSEIVSAKPLKFNILSDSILKASLNNGDLDLKLWSSSPILPFIDKINATTNEVIGQVDSMKIDISRINQTFPKMYMMLDMGGDNLVSDYLQHSSDISFNHLTGSIRNDSLLHFSTNIIGFQTGNTRLDSITLNAIQHGSFLVYDARINNKPGTFDDFAHVKINGFAGNNRFASFFRQENLKGEKGFNFGLSAEIADSILNLKLVPTKPTIAYKPWTINSDNFISFDLINKHIDANLELKGDDSSIKLYTLHDLHHDSVAPHHDINEHQEELKLSVSNIHLQDWLSLNPFAPPVKGDLNADLAFNYLNGVLTGKGTAGIDNLYYGKERVGTFDLDLDISNSVGGKLMADVSLMVDSVKTITARGVLNDSTASSPFLLDFRMIKFPLHVINPFIPANMAKVSGMLNGEMTITGDMATPIFNGFIDFDTTEVKVTMLGTSFKFSDEKIPVDSGIVSFNDFAIFANNNNPLRVNGKLNARNIANLGLNLTFDAENIQVVNSSRPKGGADVYGKAFLDIDAAVKGNMNFLSVDADLRILPGTNVTYVMTETTQELVTRQNDDMVHFVAFNDTSKIASADSIISPAMVLDLDARLHIDDGTTINVDLSANGSNKVSLQPQGDLSYSMSAFSGDRLTGRININGGFVKYSPPFMSEKHFEFNDGSYISFNGDMMNPTLNIKAVDVVKANVTQSGQNSRLVNFDVLLSLTNTLQNLDVAFDLSTDDDITVQNELASMSAEQRANQAMNLLLYNVYSGGETKGNANLSGNQLYSFLTSRLNSWAANNIRGVDISFGIDQYDKTYGGSTSTTTSYSYRVSKTFFNDRFKIVVGGNYSTDADADENFSQNLINDISFEYMLNRSGSMYIKIFRHTGYESILEGEITQTGVGFVLKRKLNSLRELFGIRKE